MGGRNHSNVFGDPAIVLEVSVRQDQVLELPLLRGIIQRHTNVLFSFATLCATTEASRYRGCRFLDVSQQAFASLTLHCAQRRLSPATDTFEGQRVHECWLRGLSQLVYALPF